MRVWEYLALETLEDHLDLFAVSGAEEVQDRNADSGSTV